MKAWSSIFIFVIAVNGLLYGNPLEEIRVSLMFIALALVGIGSTALHSTLHWFWQSSDEVPMLWQALSILYFVLEVRNEVGSKCSNMHLLYFLLVCLIQTVMYYCFQQMYVVFVFSVTLYAIIIAGCVGFLAYEDSNLYVKQDRRLLFRLAIFLYALVGSTLWIIDMNYCEYLLPYYLSSGLGGMTFHVLWHIGAGLGTYVTITFLILVRLQALKKDVYLHWVYNSLPVCKLSGSK